jgi:hypothetical protein
MFPSGALSLARILLRISLDVPLAISFYVALFFIP